MAQRLLVSVVGLFFLSLTGAGCASTIALEVQKSLRPLEAQTAEIEKQLAALEDNQNQLAKATAAGLDLVGKSVDNLAEQAARLHTQVEGMEKNATTQFKKLAENVEATKKSARAARDNSFAAKKAAETGSAETHKKLDGMETASVERAKNAHNSLVDENTKTREHVTGEVRKSVTDVTAEVIKSGDKTRSDTKDHAKRILEELEKLKPPAVVVTLPPASPPAAPVANP